MESFVTWLNVELDRRGWPRSEAARRGDISESMWSKVISGYANPGLDFCRGVARAFNMPLEDVFRMAGILPWPPNGHPVRDSRRIVYEINGDELVLELWRALSPTDQAIVRDLMERLGQMAPRIIGERPEE